MARIRTVKPEFFTSEQVADCSTTARLLFVGLWVFADDAGRHVASTKRAKMEIFPGDDFTQDDVADLIGELVDAGLIFQYEADGGQYWQITGWKHQKIEKPTVRYPAPPDPKFDDHSATDRRPIAEPSTPEWKGKESKGRERESAPAREFVPPTEEEAAGFAESEQLRIDAAAFVAHYAAIGWTKGGRPILDWKAAARSWAKKEPHFRKGDQPTEAEAKAARDRRRREREALLAEARKHKRDGTGLPDDWRKALREGAAP